MGRKTWDEYFMDIASKVAERSTCDRAMIGAVIVKDKKIIGTGYNGAPSGQEQCDEVGHLLINNHCVRSIHAEVNAILQGLEKHSLEGATLYCTHRPCIECSKLIIQVGIKEVWYESEYVDNRCKEFGVSIQDELLEKAGIKVVNINKKNKDVIVCIVGESGSGKTSIVKNLEARRFNVIHSYTTREPREENEYGHIFSNIGQYEKDLSSNSVIAETIFGANAYWATKEQYEGKGITFYAIDPKGVDKLRKAIKDKIVVVQITASRLTRIKRLFLQGFTEEQVNERIERDEGKFTNFYKDYTISNDGDFHEAILGIEDILFKLFLS